MSYTHVWRQRLWELMIEGVIAGLRCVNGRVEIEARSLPYKDEL